MKKNQIKKNFSMNMNNEYRLLHIESQSSKLLKQ